MSDFWIDPLREQEKSYSDLFSELRQRKTVQRYIRFSDPYEVFLHIIGGLISGSEIHLLDSDFSETEIDNLGIDSLMGFELINRLEAELNMTIPIAVLLQGPSLSQLTTQLLDQLDLPVALPAASDEAAVEPEDQASKQVDQLSDEEVAAQLCDWVQSINSKLEKHERIGAIVVSRTPWAQENGVLTHTLKIKRDAVAERYHGELEQAGDRMRHGEPLFVLHVA